MRALRRLIGTKAGPFVVTAVVTLGLAVPTAVWATASFSDVPTTHPFYGDITAVADAGISNGYPDGTFRPSDPVTRQAMAAFTHRAGGRIARGGTTLFGLDGGDSAVLGVATVTAGASGTGTGFVHLSGSSYAYVTATYVATCPCTVSLQIWADRSQIGSSYYQVGNVAGSDGYGMASGIAQAVVPLTAGTTRSYRLVARVFDMSSRSMAVSGELTALYVPFAGDGDNTQTTERSCPRDDGYETNDTRSFSTPLFVSANQSGSVASIVCPSDDDWYATNSNVPAAVTLTASTSFTHAEGDIDLCIVNNVGVDVACATGKVNSESVSYVVPSPGAYHVRIVLAADTGAVVGNGYSLTLSYA